MHDFDYDAMQKKRIARGAIHMKNGSKSKKCSLPHDGWTPAQLRRLNGPVHTYKLDEPMNFVDFKEMPDDLQKKYIRNLQELYRANDHMIALMFGISDKTSRICRVGLGIESLGKARLKTKEREILYAKWDAFCNGVVGGGHKVELKEEETVPAEVVGPGIGEVNPDYDSLEHASTDKVTEIDTHIDILKPEKFAITLNGNLYGTDDLIKVFERLYIPTGKCRIKIEIEKED